MMRSLGAKDKSCAPTSTSTEGSSHKKTKFTNANFQFQSELSSQESTLRALQLYQLNAALQGPPQTRSSNSMYPGQQTLVQSIVQHDAAHPLLQSLALPGLMALSLQAPHSSYPLQDALQSQMLTDLAAMTGSTPGYAAAQLTPHGMAPNRDVWSPTLNGAVTLMAPAVHTCHIAPFTLLSKAVHMAAPPLRTSYMAPFTLSCSTDRETLSVFQAFVRLHIEAFGATQAETMSRTCGRTKRIQIGQVGIRCRHCAHEPLSHRTKGSVYFPASTMGFYQAAQNMSSTHLQCGLCPGMPESTKAVFTQLMVTKTSTNCSGGGRAYWSHCVKQMGLVDTDQGVYLRETIPPGAHVLDPKDQGLYQTKAMKRPHMPV